MNKSDFEINKAVAVTDDIYTLEECESRAVQVTTARNVELVYVEVVREQRN